MIECGTNLLDAFCLVIELTTFRTGFRLLVFCAQVIARLFEALSSHVFDSFIEKFLVGLASIQPAYKVVVLTVDCRTSFGCILCTVS